MKGLAKITDQLREISNILVENGYLTREETNKITSDLLEFFKGIMKGDTLVSDVNVVSPLEGAVEIPVSTLRRKYRDYIGKRFLFYVPLMGAYMFGTLLSYVSFTDEFIFYEKQSGLKYGIVGEKGKFYLLDNNEEKSRT